MQHSNLRMVVLPIIAALAFGACLGTSGETTETGEPAALEQIEGTELNRIILSAKAAERLGVRTAPVRDEEVMRTWTVGGEVVAVPGTELADPSAVWVRVVLSEGELTKVERGRPARVLSIGLDVEQGGGGPALMAQSVEIPGAGSEEATNALYYAIDSQDHGLAPGQPVLVEIARSGSHRQVVAYAAVIYGLNGETWVYTNPEPLAFVRHYVTVDYIDGNLAVLLEGPPAGTAVVEVGAAELFGVELGVGQ